MTTLYRPALIESVEQAEALPPRTPVLMGPFVAHRPFADKGWVVTDAGGEYSSEELIAAHSHLNPTALVPIEAEEETRVTLEAFHEAYTQTLARLDYARTYCAPSPGPPVTVRTESRHLTPWE